MLRAEQAGFPYDDRPTPGRADLPPLRSFEDVKGALAELVSSLGDAIDELRRKGGKGPAPGPDAQLERAGARLNEAFGALVRNGRGLGGKNRARVVLSAAFVVGKTGRIALTGPAGIDEGEGGHADWDTSCNVLLLARSIESLRRTLETLPVARRTAPMVEALDAVTAALVPWHERISPAFHAVFQDLVRKGEAPSPFCTTAH